MAVQAMSTRTRQILYKEGHTPPDTYREVGGTVFPGAAVQVGTTLTKDCKLAILDGVFLGIAGLLPNHDIDTVYAAGTAIPIYTKGCGAVVWAQFTKLATNAVAGMPLIQNGNVVTGSVTPGEGGTDEYAGVAYRDITLVAADEIPGLIQLV